MVRTTSTASINCLVLATLLLWFNAADVFAQVVRVIDATARMQSLNQRNSPLTIVTNLSVQRELGISPELREKIQALRQTYENDERAISIERRLANEKRLVLDVEAVDKLQKLLDQEQWDRLTQIALQYHGLSIFVEPSVISALKISTEQQQQIQKINQDSTAEWQVQLRQLNSRATN